MITHSIRRQVENFVFFLVVVLWVGLAGCFGKTGSKNTLSEVLNPQKKKRQVLKTSQIFGKWERKYKLNNSINSICLILAIS